MGSGTTAAVAHKMRRQWLGIEMGEHAKTHCVPRLCAVIDGEQGGISEAEKWHGGGGFRFMRLGDEIFTQDGAVNQKSIFPHLPRTCGLPKRTHRFPRKNAKARFWAFITKPATPCCITVFLSDKKINGGNVLTAATLAHIRKAAKKYDGKIIIFANASRFGDARLKSENLEFRQIPYDCKKR